VGGSIYYLIIIYYLDNGRTRSAQLGHVHPVLSRGSGHVRLANMIRRNPTLIPIDQSAVEEVKAFLESRKRAPVATEENDSMLLDAGDGSPAPKQPYNAVEEEKKRKALLTRNQRMGLEE